MTAAPEPLAAFHPTPDDTRDRLVAAAAEVFAERGYDRAGVQEIARRAGLTTGAIYGRFSGKAELLKAAIESRTNDELDELFSQHRFDGRATDVLTTVGTHLVAHPECDPVDGESALLLEAFVASRRDADVLDLVRSILQDRAALLADLVETGKADGTVDPDLDTEAIVCFAHAVGLGFLLYDAISFSMPGAQPWAQLIARLVGSLATDAPGRTNPSKET
jgi:AcrR family transcriptional regulator